jgi:hypothetical protein
LNVSLNCSSTGMPMSLAHFPGARLGTARSGTEIAQTLN